MIRPAKSADQMPIYFWSEWLKHLWRTWSLITNSDPQMICSLLHYTGYNRFGKVEEIVLMSLLLILWMAQTCLASGDCQRVGTKSSSYPLTSKLFSRRLHHLKGPQCKQYAKPFYFILQLLQEHSFFKLVLRYFNSVGRFLIFLIFMKVWLMKYSLSRLELKGVLIF